MCGRALLKHNNIHWQISAKEVSVGPKADRGSGNDLISLVQGDGTRGVKNKEMFNDSLVFGTKSKEYAKWE